MSPEARRNALRPRIVDRTVVLVGILGMIFGGIAIASAVTDPEPIVPWTIEFVLGVTPAAGLIYAAWWLTSHRPLHDDRQQLTLSVLVGALAVGFLAVLYATQAVLTSSLNGDLVLLVATSTAVGAVVGLVAAITHAPPRHFGIDTPVSVERPSGDGAREGTRPETLTAADPTIAAVLTTPYLGALVEILDEHRGPQSSDDVAKRLADRSGLTEERARLRLHHVTLPKAEEHGLVTVDTRTGQIEPGPELDDVVSALDVLGVSISP